MTREEAIEMCDEVYKTKDCWDLVGDIFDDFESRTCKNCTWIDEDFEGIYCRLARGEGRLIEIDEQFGCNRFERKDDE